MSYDLNRLANEFMAAVEEGSEQRDPHSGGLLTIEDVHSFVDGLFGRDSSFRIGDIYASPGFTSPTTGLYIRSQTANDTLSIQEIDGSLCICRGARDAIDHKDADTVITERATPQDIVKALGNFYGQYAGAVKAPFRGLRGEVRPKSW